MELALVKVQNDILPAIDRQEEVVLVLLDFSAAYDTVEHSIMNAQETRLTLWLF